MNDAMSIDCSETPTQKSISPFLVSQQQHQIILHTSVVDNTIID